MTIASIVGARPQFIKAAPVSKALREHGHQDLWVHTGQHYDYLMSQVFFDQLQIPAPDINLGIGSGSHAWQTGQMLPLVEQVMMQEKPDWVLVYGDTNSTLAGALAASKLQLPLAHVEAGLRFFNRAMPEEHNRVLTDHCSDLLFCPTRTAVDNLSREGITQGVELVGDTMFDAILQFAPIARNRASILCELGVDPKGYLLATLHRPYNTDGADHLCGILAALAQLDVPVIFPVHPRTRHRIDQLSQSCSLDLDISPIKLIEPVGYLDMLVLEENARTILTDSGGMQKEAYYFGVPCVTLRSETEWLETVQAGWNIVVGLDPSLIWQAIHRTEWPSTRPPLFGSGDAALRILDSLERRRDQLPHLASRL